MDDGTFKIQISITAFCYLSRYRSHALTVKVIEVLYKDTVFEIDLTMREQ